MTYIFTYGGDNFTAYERSGVIYVSLVGRGVTHLLDDIKLPEDINGQIQRILQDDTDT